MVAVEKYKLLLLRLMKNNMHQTNACFCDKFIRVVYFQIKHAKKYLMKRFEIESISVFPCACFLGTLRFYNKLFAIWEDSKVKFICLKCHEVRKHFHLFIYLLIYSFIYSFIYLFIFVYSFSIFYFFPKLQRKYKQNINIIEYTIMLQYAGFPECHCMPDFQT